MATIQDIAVSAAINIFSVIVFLLAFAFLRLQPFNDRVYFPKWYLKGSRESPTHGSTFVRKFVNLDMRSYLKFLSWMPAALKMPEDELISHAGLDSAVYLRIYLIGYVLYTVFAFQFFVCQVGFSYTRCSVSKPLLVRVSVNHMM
jgi:calcium permeable stress-gated cation channel